MDTSNRLANNNNNNNNNNTILTQLRPSVLGATTTINNIFTSHLLLMTNNIFFEPVQILLFREDQPHIQYYDNIILQSTPTENIEMYPSPTISYGSRRNSLFSSHSSNHSFNYDSTDDSLPYHNNSTKPTLSQRSSTLNLQRVTTPTNMSTSTVSITKLRSSNKVKDKALLFEKLIQDESKDHHPTPHYQYSLPHHIHNNNNLSFSLTDDTHINNNSSKTKYLSKTYISQLERSKSPITSIPNTPTRRIVSTKLTEYENHINNLNHFNSDK
ncbi:hypothetical protein MOSE0_L05710 [Monosporozyma servazzii]